MTSFPSARAPRRASSALVLSLLVWSAAFPAAANAQRRCSIENQLDVCLGQNLTCPAYAGEKGPQASEWPMFQHDAQHTGKTSSLGPSSPAVLWMRKVKGPMYAAPSIGLPPPGGTKGVIYVSTHKYPICALNPANGAVYWCKTQDAGKIGDQSAPALGNGSTLYVGTRDNDLWAIDSTPAVPQANRIWRQKVCTDGDVSTPPSIDSNGIVYMGSDSLGSGTIMAMCPGATLGIKWCINPIGAGVKTLSPALSPAEDKVYITTGGSELRAYRTTDGIPVWTIELDKRRNGARRWNFTPVVHPTTGRIYVGFDDGVWAVDEAGSTPVATLLYATRSVNNEIIASPPAIDVANDRLYFIAAFKNKGTFYAIDLAGNLKWSQSLGRTNGRNVPPVIDGNGNVYLAAGQTITSWTKTGTVRWTFDEPAGFTSSPALGNGRLYVGTLNGKIYALGAS